MTKQEQIKEMAEAIVRSAIIANAKIDNKCAINLKEFIDSLYKAGYRKLPEEAVIMTKKEFKELTEEINFWHKVNETALILTKEECDHKIILDEDHFERALNYERENARKETAKKIIEKILGYLGSNQKFIIADEKDCVWVDYEKLFDYLKKIAEENEIEVEE